jgi:hypothetical protein
MAPHNNALKTDVAKVLRLLLTQSPATFATPLSAALGALTRSKREK